MNTNTSNTFLALKEAERSLNLARQELANVSRMDTRQFGEAFVQRRIVKAEASVEKWEVEIIRLNTEGVSNQTTATVTSDEQSEKAKRKAAKKAAKRNNLLRGNAQIPTQRRRHHNQAPRLTMAERREQQMARELDRFENFTLKKELQKKLEQMPNNQGMRIGGILHFGGADPTGDPQLFSYTERDASENKVYEYVVSPAAEGYKRVVKYHRGVEVSTHLQRNPFGSMSAQRQYTPLEADFPVLEKAHIIPQSPSKRKYRSWAAAAVQNTTPTEPVSAPVESATEETPVAETSPSPPHKTQQVQPTAPEAEFTTVSHKRKEPKNKITLTPAMEARVAKMPANVGMFVRNKIFWGKQRATPHPTKMATKLATVNGQKGVLRYTWSSRVYREHFKAQNGREWELLRNDRTNGERIMASFA